MTGGIYMQKQNITTQQISAVSRKINSVYHDLNRKIGLSDTESTILYAIAADGNISQKAICSQLGLSKQTINSAVKKMINDEILEPLVGQRNERLVVTAKGKQIIEEKISIIVELENRIMNTWTEQDKIELVRLTEKFYKALMDECEKLAD